MKFIIQTCKVLNASSPNIMFNFKISMLAVFCLLSCAAPSQTTAPVAPKEQYNYQQAPVEKQTSIINLPLDISLTDIEKQINTTITGLVYEDNSYENDNQDNFKCKVWKRGNIAVTAATNDVFNFTVPLKIWAEKGFKVSLLGLETAQYKDTEFEMNIKFSTKFSLNPDWSVSTLTTPNGFDWVTKPVLKLGVVEVPLTAIISKIITNNHAKFAGSLDNAVRENINLKPYILQGWNVASQPYLVSEEYRTWVKITPIEILMTPLKSLGRNIRATLGFKVLTETFTGEKPKAATLATILPPLKLVQQIPNEFKVGLMSTVPFKEAAAIASKMFVGQKFDFQSGKFNIDVTGIDIYGSGDKMIIKTAMKGSLNGTIYFKGIPTYDPAKRAVVLKDLDFDLETKNVLVKTASWLLAGKMAKTMEEKFGMPVDDLINITKQNVENSLSQPIAKGVKLNGKIEDVQPDKVYLTPEGIISVVFAKGKLDLKIDGMF